MSGGQRLRPFPELERLMARSLAPCFNFGLCKEARWAPAEGHIPRGYVGALGTPLDVRLVIVFAEPGNPHDGEFYDEKLSPDELIEAPILHAYQSFKHGRDLFHRNLRWFLDQVFPDLTFDEQLRHTWLTEGRLCSFSVEIGGKRESTCAKSFLASQISMMPNAFVVGAGGKASEYLRLLGIPFQPCHAFAPPGANQKAARPSWERAISNARTHISKGP